MRWFTTLTLGSLVVLAGLVWLTLSDVGAVGPFTSPVVVTGIDTGEPDIDVGPGGELYINAPSGVLSSVPPSASYLFRSDDGGASWIQTPNGVRDLLPGGGDADAAVDQQDGTVYFVDLWLGNSTVSVSHDKGETWVSNPFGSVPIQDRPWQATPGGGRAYVATHQVPVGIVVSKSVDGGITYPLSSVAATVLDQTGCVCPSGALIAEDSGLLGLGDKVGVIYPTSTGGVKFARSTNGGLTFASTVVSQANGVDTTTNFPVVANAGGGHLVAVWLEITGGRNKTTRVRFNDSTDWGATWKQPRSLVGTGTSVFPWVDARGAKVAVTLYHTTAVATPDTAPEDAAWFETYLESTNGGTSFSSPLTVDATPVKTGPICTEGANCTEDRELLDFQSVVIDAAGRSNATWTRSINNMSDTEIRFARQL